jgi:hypothetical protein
MLFSCFLSFVIEVKAINLVIDKENTLLFLLYVTISFMVLVKEDTPSAIYI